MTTLPTPVSRGQAPHRLYLILLTTLVLLLTAGLVIALQYSGDDATVGVHGSGVEATQTRQLPSFTSVDLAGANVVTVHVGDKQAVVVHADDNLLQFITTDVRDGELVIANTGTFTARSPMRVDATVPNLDAATLSGAGVVTVDTVKAEKFVARLPGTGVLHVSGTVRSLDATLNGTGDLQLQNLISHDATVAVAGSGRLQVNTTGTLDASVSGSGAIFYQGNPTNVTRSVTGSGAINAQ
jgi:Putative auto-transporter adhesin, head GIN domain